MNLTTEGAQYDLRHQKAHAYFKVNTQFLKIPKSPKEKNSNKNEIETSSEEQKMRKRKKVTARKLGGLHLENMCANSKYVISHFMINWPRIQISAVRKLRAILSKYGSTSHSYPRRSAVRRKPIMLSLILRYYLYLCLCL